MLFSCTTTPVTFKDIGLLGQYNIEILGPVEIIMKNVSTDWWGGTVTYENKQEAYLTLLTKAKIVYGRNDIDIINISITGQNGDTCVDLTASGYAIVSKQ
ncbi:MAG: hypothetical protein PQJ46_00370 [Spirochaetales bacterium]|nr:hypothetical protein [Spirochaetales bacterium]